MVYARIVIPIVLEADVFKAITTDAEVVAGGEVGVDVAIVTTGIHAGIQSEKDHPTKIAVRY